LPEEAEDEAEAEEFPLNPSASFCVRAAPLSSKTRLPAVSPAFTTRRTSPSFPIVSALRFLLGVCVILSVAHAAPPGGAVIREPGAIYLEDFSPRTIKIPVKDDAAIYYKPDLGRYLGTLKKGQMVELQAITDDAYRVRGVAQQGQVVGWVPPAALAPLKKEFLENLKQNAARRTEVDALIAKNEVAVNMTPDEVVASLGKPTRKTSRLDNAGQEQVWEFVKYERVPQESTGYDRFGRLVSSVVYIKVPSGKLSVSFDNNLVSSIEQTEGTPDHDARAKLIPAPLVFVN
jgi:hypothetical protein